MRIRIRNPEYIGTGTYLAFLVATVFTNNAAKLFTKRQVPYTKRRGKKKRKTVKQRSTRFYMCREDLFVVK
jgi:hypothetical protein